MEAATVMSEKTEEPFPTPPLPPVSLPLCRLGSRWRPAAMCSCRDVGVGGRSRTEGIDVGLHLGKPIGVDGLDNDDSSPRPPPLLPFPYARRYLPRPSPSHPLVRLMHPSDATVTTRRGALSCGSTPSGGARSDWIAAAQRLVHPSGDQIAERG